MPSMLVFVDQERLAALRGDVEQPWTVRRGELLDRDLVSQADWTLYVTTVRDDTVRVVAYIENTGIDPDTLGDATPCDVDITPLLERLGCFTGVGGYATWAIGPSVLTKNDADLLRYRLGLPLDLGAPPPMPPPPPRFTTGFEHDAIAMTLLDEVHEDPASDANRMVLADRLLELGDPRGEMMALQLARARSGAPATPRERELITRYGQLWIKPLAGHLAVCGFRRGFLATAMIDDRVTMTTELLEHPIWSTVEELETVNPTVLVAPSMRALRRVAIPGSVLDTLARHDEPLAIETIVGSSGGLVEGGVELPLHDLRPLAQTRVLDRVRSMRISIETRPLAQQASAFLRTRLGLRLEHVELFAQQLATVDVEPWRHIFERNRPHALGLRGLIDGWTAVIVRQRGTIILQLGNPPSELPPHIRPLVPVVANLGERLGSITVEHVGEGSPAVDLRPVAEQLRRAFLNVALVSTHRWRSP